MGDFRGAGLRAVAGGMQPDVGLQDLRCGISQPRSGNAMRCDVQQMQVADAS
jgi:hypothetical protein